MARYSDFDRLDYFGPGWADRLVAIGWVESIVERTDDSVDERFFELLTTMLVDPWQPFAAGGFHRCLMCRFTGGPATLQYGSRRVQIGANNLFVPDGNRVFVAPSSIVHYIDAHGYCPPLAFQQAVRNSPVMRSMDYLKSIRRFDLHRMTQPSALL